LIERLGIVVGLVAEARIARSLGQVVAGNGTAAGALAAAERLAATGARALLSFGIAAGLDPALRPGALVIPRAVLLRGEARPIDPEMLAALGGATMDLILAKGDLAKDAGAKRQLWQQTGAAALDLESGAVACAAQRHGLRFAVLRAICDPAERALPPAALVALDQDGAIRSLRVLASVAAAPSQIPALFALARDAAAARRALIRCVAQLRDRFASM
jgi:adenosylhomocysteine nucleosidase